MLQNFFKIAWRNFWKQKVYSVINVFGLALGLTATIFIFRYVQDELSYDQFHEKGERMYRITESFKNGEEYTTTAMSPYKIAPLLAEYSPAVESFTRIDTYVERQILQVGDEKHEEMSITYVDSTFFQNFSFQLLQGDPKTVLTEPYTMVLSEEKAQQIFGAENPIGKTIAMTRGYSAEKYQVEVTGVMETMPANSHFHYDFLLSMATADILIPNRIDSWGWTSQYSYIVLKKGHSIAEVEPLLAEIRDEHAPEWFQEWAYFGVQPMTDIHLKSQLKDEIEANGSMANVYIFSLVGLFILLIAGINYMNLATARAAGRAKEVGMRKVIGARRKHLIYQFLCESVLVSLLAFAVAIVAAELLLPFFNNLTGKSLDSALFDQPLQMAAGLGIVSLIGLLAGSYPAFFLSGFQPLKVLKGTLAKAGTQTLLLRKGLVVFQFAISIALIVGILVINQQWQFLRSKNLGIETEQTLVIPIQSQRLLENYDNFKQELLTHSGVLHVTATNKTPLSVFTNYATLELNGTERAYTLPYVAIDDDFFATYEAEVIEGRAFTTFQQDSNRVILNEAAVELLELENPVGTELTFGSGFEPTVIGVVKDFNFESLYSEIRPMYFFLSTGNLSFISMRIRPENVEATLAHLNSTWQQFDLDESLTYSFLDEDINSRYQAEALFLKIFTAFGILGILIACLGIFGLASYSATQRSKEVSIRKVLGAGAEQIAILLSKDFLKLVGLAFLVATPIAWFGLQAWLENYVYRIDLSIFTFALAGLMALLIALLSVSYQSIRTALMNPVHALKQE